MSSAVLAPALATADVTENLPADQHRSETDTDRRLLDSFGAASVSLTEAMSTAERLQDGSRTNQISFNNSGVGGYRVRTLKDDRLCENVIDANTGKQSIEEKSLLLGQLSEEDRNSIAALKFVRQQLADAVAVAEGDIRQGTCRRPDEGWGKMKDGGKLNFVVIVASENRLKQVMLEPPRVVRSGKESRRSP